MWRRKKRTIIMRRFFLEGDEKRKRKGEYNFDENITLMRIYALDEDISFSTLLSSISSGCPRPGPFKIP